MFTKQDNANPYKSPETGFTNHLIKPSRLVVVWSIGVLCPMVGVIVALSLHDYVNNLLNPSGKGAENHAAPVQNGILLTSSLLSGVLVLGSIALGHRSFKQKIGLVLLSVIMAFVLFLVGNLIFVNVICPLKENHY